MNDITKRNKEIMDEGILIKAIAKSGRLHVSSPKEYLSYGIEEALYNLFVHPTGAEANYDYDMEAWEYKQFMLDLLTLLAMPGILEKLPNRQEDASKRLRALHTFFDCLDLYKVDEYLDYLALTQWSGCFTNKDLREKLDYYDFSKRHLVRNNYFNSLTDQQETEEKQVAAYNELNKN